MRLFTFMTCLLFYTTNVFANPVLKDQIRGLIDRQNTSWMNQDEGTPEFTMDHVNQFPGLFAGIVINTSWAALQPTPNGDLDLSTIQHPLDQITEYNKQHPDRPLAVKLRVFAGANAPTWAKMLDGSPFTIYRNPVGPNCSGAPTCPLTVGRFWDVNSNYVKAWRSLQQKLANQYDQEPLIRQVAVTSCTQQTDEPFTPTTDKTARNNLYAAGSGYHDAAQQLCLESAATIDYAPWKYTLIDFSFNPFSYMEPDAKGQNMDVTKRIMDNCIDTLGKQCILDAQAVGKKGQDMNTPIFAAIASLAAQNAKVNLQTASPAAMGNDPKQPPNMTIWANTFTQAYDMKASGLEVWCEKIYGGFDLMSQTQACALLNILLPGTIPKPPCE